jgi:bacillithiol system protein YtxJ
MDKHFSPIGDTAELEGLVSRSHNGPVLIFKHSLTCPVSMAAYREMSKLNADVALVIVQRARDVSVEVANLTGIEHESPQLIVLRDGKAVWHASHWKVTSEAVVAALGNDGAPEIRTQDASL